MSEMDELVMDLAFAIDDPCGLDAIQLARALIEFGRSIPAAQRVNVAKSLTVAAAKVAAHTPADRTLFDRN